MCGIAGFQSLQSSPLQEVCDRISAQLTHRGPDDAGVWIDSESGLALCHRRLAVIDVSATGHQPMVSSDGRLVLAYNGEIYNHLEIREELEATDRAWRWRGHSDTETLLAAFSRWGVEASLRRCRGMFAIALWDRRQRELTLARDRVGEKPLYYSEQRSHFFFASELKALRAHPQFRAEVDQGALSLYLRHMYVPDPLTIYRGVRKLEPGHLIRIRGARASGAPVAYWDAVLVRRRAMEVPFRGSAEEAVSATESLLRSAVSGQMLADVPLGAFLSGGVDSSTIVSLMQEQSSRPVKTFSIGFRENAYDEARFARLVARHLGTEHTELIVTPEEAMAVIPQLADIYDEPFADSSQIPTLLVSQLARRHVTVALSGDAGDELFGGYYRYGWGSRIYRKGRRVPLTVRRLLTRAILSITPDQWTTIGRHVSKILPRSARLSQFGDRLHKLAEILPLETPGQLYKSLVSHWQQPSEVMTTSNNPESRLDSLMRELPELSFEESMMLWDLMTYLPGDILVKTDRAAMAVSLETRVPLLDHRLIEFAWSLPLDMKIRSGITKWPLREILYRRVPRALIERPKMGFGVPIDTWLRSSLRQWAEDLLSPASLRQIGAFRVEPVWNRWREHCEGRRNWAYWLWDVLMFQAWARKTGVSIA
ncbi:MAG: asparagine synthase (glutamine-hydrolyzing) [Proteobacteria bacterium]|nr:asparagine synthase (glutamine-hydrolyzing) [Pseudomonadota bacterium]